MAENNQNQEKDIFLANPIEGGYTYTITSILGEILKVAQETYGSRDTSFNILGVELTTQNQPQIWFPSDCGDIVIQITQECKFDIVQATYQTAHEAIHCLCPVKFGSATFLEEGLATYFSHIFVKSFWNADMNSSNLKYKMANDMAKDLLEISPNVIYDLRKTTPNISAITKETLLEYNPSIPIYLAEKLTANFQLDV